MLQQPSPSAKEAPPTIDVSNAPAPPSSADKGSAIPRPETTSEENKSSSAKPSQMIFNGPVFFGYSAEDAAALMQQLAQKPAD
jgi:hypothetical protein